ncbi:MAG: S41 family peptidase [Ekhidna sp.]
MRQLSLFTILFCLFLTNLTAQPAPLEKEQSLSKIDRIYYTCKVWGFLKYYHPLVSRGAFDWDDKMQKVLGFTSNFQTHAQLSDYMARWIYNLGAIKPCTSCQPAPYDPFLKNFDLSWTQSSVFTDKLKETLKGVEENRFQGDHYYIGQGKIQEFEPKNELPQQDLNWKDENQRLLPLFRYWNYIEYFYPYKYQTEQSWDDVLKEMIPKFLAAKTKLDFHLAMLELVVKVDDSHAGFMTPTLEQMPYYNYLPARFDMIEDQLVITEIIDEQKAQMADLQVGDIIKTINNESAIDLHDSNKKYIWGSNESVKNRSLYHTLFMGIQGPVQATIERDGSTKTTSLTLYKYADLTYTKTGPKAKWTTPSDSIGYVNMGELVVGDVDQMMGELMDKTVIIFDIRNSPRGTYRAISKYLNPSDTIFVRYTKPDYTYPGKFVWQGEASCGGDNPDYFKGLVVLLVNENTQSHAEFTCMCLQTAPNVVVVGSETAGTDGKVSRFALVSRLYTAMSGIGVYYPDGSETQRVGIVPDIYVEPTLTGIIEGRDEVLEKAMEVAKEQIAEEMAAFQAALAKAKMDSIAVLDSLALLDSMRMDSLQMNTLPMDSLGIDSLKVDNRNGDN